MKTGDRVIWGFTKCEIIAEYDSEYVSVGIGATGAQLVHVSELVPA
jgi:hypothetical protein